MTDINGDALLQRKNDLLRSLKRFNRVTDTSLRAFSKVPREKFVLSEYKRHAYSDRPLPILHDQTISAPHMCVMILDFLDLKPGQKVLEVGAGSGYQAALIAEIVGQAPQGHVFSIERIQDLVDFANKNLHRAGYDKQVTVIHGDGTLGYEEEAPFDRIIVTAAGPIIPPPLKAQLKVDGVLSMPLGRLSLYQKMIKLRRISKKEFKQEDLLSVAFVPLRGKHGV